MVASLGLHLAEHAHQHTHFYWTWQQAQNVASSLVYCLCHSVQTALAYALSTQPDCLQSFYPTQVERPV